EVRKKQSEITKRLWNNPEYRAKYPVDHFSQMAKKLWQNPEFREKKQADQTVTVKVTEANRGGLIIKTGRLIGFLPVSQLSNENYPRVEGGDKDKILDELNKFVGQEMEVKIIDLDQKIDKLIVSEKAT
ncbi:unnamed protein product, partial [marine sediment metagenome]